MTAIAHVARAYALENRDTLHVAAITGLTLAVASSVLLRFGSFAKLLAALGLTVG
jgi:hypothetical protein